MIAQNTSTTTTPDAQPAADPSAAQHGATRRNISQNPPDVAPFPLTDQQRRAAHLLALGRSDRAVRAQLGLSRYAIWRWRTRNPAFRAELARRREALWHNSADRLRSLMPRALKVLAAHMKSNYDRTSFRAAVSILRLAGANRIAPPNEPTSEIDIMRQEILRDRARDGGDPDDMIIGHAEFLEKYDQLLADCAPDHLAPEYQI